MTKKIIALGCDHIVTDEKIIMDGQAYTLDEIEAILDDPATDLTKVVEVDGQYISLLGS